MRPPLPRLARRARACVHGLRERVATDDRAAWHALDVEEALARLGSGFDGLEEGEAARRRREHGPNVTGAGDRRSRLGILAAQFANLPTALLLGSAGASVLLRELVDAAVIQAVVVLNAAIGFRIESHNEDLIASWKKLDAGEARVLRGELRVVPAADLVPGDVLVVQAGDVVAADARLVDAHRLSCEEAPLTGESEPQRKGTQAVDATAPLAGRTPMLYAGTIVASGRGRAVVVATGAGTEVARVRALVEETKAPPSPLERRIDDLGRNMTVASAGAGAAAAVAGLLRGAAVGQVLRSGVALGVAAIPEGLPVTVTASLVRAVRRMRREGMFVRRMSAVETLGGVTVVCADKTGTLTANEMRLETLDRDGRQVAVRPLVHGEDPFADPGRLALSIAVLNSDVDVHGANGNTRVVGSSTERAFVTAAEANGMTVTWLRERFPRRALRERRENVHYVVSLHDRPDGSAFACIKGAPEQVVALCERDLEGPLDAGSRERILERNERLAADGLRVLALGWRPRCGGGREVPVGGFTFVALAALRDPLRAGSAEAVRDARRAGIRTLILTGDQRATAAAIARQVGLIGRAVDGATVLADLRRNGHDALEGVSVLARVTPADKLAIVRALRDRGEIVAMAGDGVNDAPALKAADVGIAVGTATDVARQTADVVLAHEDLRSILAAVGEGRIVGDNLRRAVRYLTTTNLSEVALVLGGALAGLETMSPLHLLWVNLLTDTVPALALALEPGDPGVLDRPPSPPGAPIVARQDWAGIAVDAALMAGLGGVAFALGGPGAVFGALPAAQLAYTLLCRAPGAPARGRFAAMLGGAGALHVAALGLPPFRSVLRITAPAPVALAWAGAGIALPLGIAAVRRVVLDRGLGDRSSPAHPPGPAAVAPPPRRSSWKVLTAPLDGLLGRDVFVVQGAAVAA
jgi:Ca2+-transporting ATPase